MHRPSATQAASACGAVGIASILQGVNLTYGSAGHAPVTYLAWYGIGVFALLGAVLFALLSRPRKHPETPLRSLDRAIGALDQQRQYGDELYYEITGKQPPAPLHKHGPQKDSGVIRTQNPSDPGERVQQWIYETQAVVEQHTHGEVGRFLNDIGFPDAGTDDPATRLEYRLLRLEEIINDLRRQRAAG